MSGMDKPKEDKKPDLECSLNPERYKSQDVVAPRGSFPWIMIQLDLGWQVSRRDWSDPNEYLYLIPQSTQGNISVPSHIGKHFKPGLSASWQPTPEDLMACDWGINYELTFDCILNKVVNPDGDYFGYFGDSSAELQIFENNRGFAKILSFYWDDAKDPENSDINWIVISSGDEIIANNLSDFMSMKSLYVTVDGVTYNLGTTGVGIRGIEHLGKAPYEFTCGYWNNDFKKLGEILKQTGERKCFHFKWV
ncbi:MW1434 family type I TA system toxin [Xenorhabdus szentirmaii]|uniref:Thoeris anti-defense Tad2 family protein n=1 Tax=Xenorhabdus szentirmaii TaxID=290112 RepID=UPI0032B88316